MDYEGYYLNAIIIMLMSLLVAIIPLLFFIFLFNRNRKKEELPQFVFYGLSDMKKSSSITKLDAVIHKARAKQEIKKKRKIQGDCKWLRRFIQKFIIKQAKKGNSNGCLIIDRDKLTILINENLIKQITKDLELFQYSVDNDILNWYIYLVWSENA